MQQSPNLSPSVLILNLYLKYYIGCINAQLIPKILYRLTWCTKVKLHVCFMCLFLNGWSFLQMWKIYIHFSNPIYSINNGLAHSCLDKWSNEWTCEWKTLYHLNTFLLQCNKASLSTDNCIRWLMVTTYFCISLIYSYILKYI